MKISDVLHASLMLFFSQAMQCGSLRLVALLAVASVEVSQPKIVNLLRYNIHTRWALRCMGDMQRYHPLLYLTLLTYPAA